MVPNLVILVFVEGVEILANGSREEHRVLRNDSQLGAQVVEAYQARVSENEYE